MALAHLRRRRSAAVVFALCLAVSLRGSVTLSGQDVTPPPPPLPDAGAEPNIFYGGLNPLSNAKAPVLVFVHGLGGTASDWWLRGDMYDMAFRAGYRTAFVSLSADNSRNNGTMAENALVLQVLLPAIARRYQAEKLYLIGHSKGGLDIQAALLTPAIARLTKAVFTISSPNSGTELADWVFDHPVFSQALGLLTPAMSSLGTETMTQFRTLVDPIFARMGIPFYTTTGNVFYNSAATLFTGLVLWSMTPNVNNDSLNDGLVTVARSRLPATYSADLGQVNASHFETSSGSVSFSKIRSVISGLELTFKEFERIASDGFREYGGDSANSWSWAMKWFKGHLYVGTARENNCVTFLTSDARAGTGLYPIAQRNASCPDPETLLRSLGAEIWRYTAETKQWQRVFKSPDSIFLGLDSKGNQLFTGRDVGFRGMEIFVEPDGTEALYVGGVTSGSLLEPSPFQPNGFPTPRILRTIDGSNWTPLPQTPGTFLGEVGNILVNPTTKYRSFRSITSYKGKLFATLADFIGVGPVIVSDNPAAGDDAWHFAGPEGRDDFPVWHLTSFNGFLYATTGLTRDLDPEGKGYGVYKTDAEGTPPYTWTPIVTDGGNQTNRTFLAPNGLSMAEFKGQLYVGTNRPTELIRINPDDSWDLLVGEPRMTPQGFKTPLTGMGNGMGNWFTGHFWRMAVWQDHLYLTTWDFSISLQQFSFMPSVQKLFDSNYGLDIYRTSDGIHWTALTRNGLGDPNNAGGRSLEPTPFGLFIGTTRQHGLQIFRTDGPAPEPAHLPAPKNLTAANESDVGRTVALTWDPSPGAVRYQVFRAMAISLGDVLGGGDRTSFRGTDGKTYSATYKQMLEGKLDAVCAAKILESTLCASLDVIRRELPPVTAAEQTDMTAFPLPYSVIAFAENTTFTEPAPTRLQSLYFVRAVDAEGNLSAASNFVAAPSKLNAAQPLQH